MCGLVFLLILTAQMGCSAGKTDVNVEKEDIQEIENKLVSVLNYDQNYEIFADEMKPYVHSMKTDTVFEDCLCYPYFLGGIGIGFEFTKNTIDL